jgi:hypothetical protein
MTSTIALVLDPKFEARLAGLAQEMSVWIVSSEENNAAVEHVRSLLGGATNITTLSVAGDETESDICLRALYAIDEHHGDTSSVTPYDRVMVFGGVPDMLTPQAMAELGLSNVARSDIGFTVEKHRRQAALSHIG